MIGYGYRADGEEVWFLLCEGDGCNAQTCPTAAYLLLPFAEYQRAGWFVAVLGGDRCPACVAAGRMPWRAVPWRGVEDVPVRGDLL